MLADIFMNLLYFVGIIVLCAILIGIIINVINEIKYDRIKDNVINELTNVAIKSFQEELDKEKDKNE